MEGPQRYSAHLSQTYLVKFVVTFDVKIVRKIEFGAARIAQRTCCECNSNSSLKNRFGGARAASQKFWYSKVCNSGRLAASQISAETIPSLKSLLVRSLDFSKAMQLEKTLKVARIGYGSVGLDKVWNLLL